jgi:hypothetical protein
VWQQSYAFIVVPMNSTEPRDSLFGRAPTNGNGRTNFSFRGPESHENYGPGMGMRKAYRA